MNLKKHTSENNKVIQLYKNKWNHFAKGRDKKRWLVSLGILIFILVVILGIKYHVYHDYRVISSANNEDTQSAGYVQLGDGLLKYGDDGAYFLSQSQEILWNQTFEMSNPTADVRGEQAVIYDQKGTKMFLLNKDKPVSDMETKFPILQAEITEKGSVAAILEDGEKTWINYYASDGTVIAENQTRIENPGYPLDMTVSPGGETIAVSFLQIDNGALVSRIVFYNFGDAGQNKEDNIVADYEYENTIIPQVIYLDNETAVAFRDDGYSIFKGTESPQEKTKEVMEEEIVSTFHDEKYFGLVMKGTDEKDSYVMQLYSPSGKKMFSKKIAHEYQSVDISNEMIVMYDGSDVKMYDLKGILKFDGTIEEGAVKNIFQMSSKRYIVISENGINTISLKW